MADALERQRFRRLRALFEAASELDPVAAEAYVAREAGDDRRLARELRRMLAGARDDPGFLAPPVAGDLADERIPLVLAPGDRVGQYVVERRVGSGGMGAVYRARQDRPARVVALKVLDVAATPAALRRFELEGEILARLSHPAIAAIHEAGVHRTADGDEVPYLCMEYVEGARDVLRYAREERLDLPRKLALFREVCAAVHHAHLRGVIHRDLKPGNVLVDASGRPKVIDYGIARVQSPDVASDRLTRAGHFFGTLQYASPEQIAGHAGDVDVRADVYALGVLLHELVTGRPPHASEGRPLPEFLAEVCERDARPPSAWQPDLARELDWIVLRALAKDRDRRYGTAAELALDLARFERREPVAAGPATARYRLRKFVARHRIAVAAAFVVLVTLVAAIAGTGRALVEAREQGARATRALRSQTAVIDALRETIGAVRPDRDGRAVTLAEILERRSASLDAGLVDEPEVRAALQSFLSNAYGALGLDEPAAVAGEDVLAALERVEEPDLEFRAAARLALARLRAKATRLDEAAALLALAREDLSRADAAMSPAAFEARRLDAELAEKAGDVEGALRRHDVSLRDASASIGLDHEAALRIAIERASLLLGLQRLDEAEAAARDVRARRVALHGAGDARTLPASTLLGTILQRAGRTEGLVELQSSIVEATLRAYGETHENSVHALQALASAQLGALDAAAAEATARRALELAEARHPDDDELDLAVRAPLAAALRGLDRNAEAIEILERGIARASNGPLARHPQVAAARSALSDAYLQAGDRDAAEAVLAEALLGFQAALPPQHPHVLVTAARLASLRFGARRDEATANEMRAAFEALQPVAHPYARQWAERLADELAGWTAERSNSAESTPSHPRDGDG